jgi:H3 lysine-79-specific histone-lysine N-methyltransferase
MKELCDKFNKIIDSYLKLNRGTESFSARLEERATAKLFRHILAQVYSRAVTDPDKLRDYEPFSPSVNTKTLSKSKKNVVFFVQVYGETSPDLIDSILKIINLNEEQTFIDLGSGVGNVVLHVAALGNCKHVYGIEHEETPATYARAMSDEFRFWMRWYGKHHSEFQLEQGDFLTHSKIDERIREADVIFANNYVFGSTVNHELKNKFMNMKGKNLNYFIYFNYLY